jgi:hypothetical protein
MRSPFCVSVYPPYQNLNAGTNLYEISYVYHGNRALLTGVLYKSLPLVCVYMYVARQQLGKKFYAATNTHKTIDGFFDTSFSTRSMPYQRKAGY